MKNLNSQYRLWLKEKEGERIERNWVSDEKNSLDNHCISMQNTHLLSRHVLVCGRMCMESCWLPYAHIDFNHCDWFGIYYLITYTACGSLKYFSLLLTIDALDIFWSIGSNLHDSDWFRFSLFLVVIWIRIVMNGLNSFNDTTFNVVNGSMEKDAWCLFSVFDLLVFFLLLTSVYSYLAKR